MSILGIIRRRLASPRPSSVDESRRVFLRGLLTSGAAVVVAPAAALEALDAMAHRPRVVVHVTGVDAFRWIPAQDPRPRGMWGVQRTQLWASVDLWPSDDPWTDFVAQPPRWHR